MSTTPPSTSSSSQPATGSFNGWTDITVDGDISSVGTTNLWGVTLQVEQPSTVTDLSFLSTLTGQAVTSTATTTVVTQDTFPRNTPTVSLNVKYLGDLHPLFESSDEIHLVWTGDHQPRLHGVAVRDGHLGSGDIRINVP